MATAMNTGVEAVGAESSRLGDFPESTERSVSGRECSEVRRDAKKKKKKQMNHTVLG